MLRFWSMRKLAEITIHHPLRRQPLSRLAVGCISACIAGMLALPAEAADGSSLTDSIQRIWKEATTSIQFGGFVSQGFLANTGHNDYLGNTSQGSFDFREYGVNASYALGQWRFGMQVFGQKLGTYGDDKLEIDWATVDYQPSQWFGLRGGRVKMPRGLYNEALDLDSVRPFVLLPQSVYDARLRDFNAAFDGGMIFGNVGLKKYGSLDYRVFYGRIPIAADSGASDYFNNDYPSKSLEMKMDSVRGGTLFWNTPLTGLRAGYSYSAFQNLRSTREASVPLGPPSMPEVVVVGTKSTPLYNRHLFSLEYSTGPWVFAAEAGREQATYHITGNGLDLADLNFRSYSFYFSVARRINPWLEVGAYYSYSRDTESLIGMTPVQIGKQPALTQADLALSARFDITPNLIFKLEGHYMDGAGKIFDTVNDPQPVAERDPVWFLFAAKLTYSF